MSTSDDPADQIEAVWRAVLVEGHHSRLSVLPGAPRCIGCHIPVGGVGSTVLRPFGRGIPSRKSPNICNYCDTVLPRGGAEVDVAVLFADVRGSTGLAEKMGPRAFANLLNRFYRAAQESLLARDAMIDKMIGDEIMALFIPNMGADYRQKAVLAAEDIMRAVGYGGAKEPWLPLGISVHAGVAYVGKVGTDGVNDFTALGDTINTAARLQAEAKPGQIILSDVVYEDVADRYPGLEPRVVAVRGRDETITVRVVEPDAPARK